MTGALLAQLSETPRQLADLVARAGDSSGTTGSAGGWSLHTIAAHLLDDESFDFRLRLERMLSEDAPHFTGYPWGTGMDRRGEGIVDIVREFALQRQASLNLLGSLEDAEFAREAAMPSGAALSIRQLIEEWLEHDREHLEQAAELLRRIDERR